MRHSDPTRQREMIGSGPSNAAATYDRRSQVSVQGSSTSCIPWMKMELNFLDNSSISAVRKVIFGM
ncbi:hypothetical protein FS749_013066 [Ceratobasidium sp. UAMH 11750]|nr:hypothetical protein FS749_013066 [Ceratobasidium sp. UAMH 11750]